MTELDPIIAVKDVQASAEWYQQLFGFNNAHGGPDFAVLKSENDDIILCLHKWAAHNHPSLTDPNIASGNGLLLYFRIDNLKNIFQKALNANCKIEEEIHLNPNSLREEFSIRDPDGYFLTVTEFHKYEG